MQIPKISNLTPKWEAVCSKCHFSPQKPFSLHFSGQKVWKRRFDANSMIPEIFLELIQHKMANLQLIFQNTVLLRYRSYGDGTATVPNPGLKLLLIVSITLEMI